MVGGGAAEGPPGASVPQDAALGILAGSRAEMLTSALVCLCPQLGVWRRVYLHLRVCVEACGREVLLCACVCHVT